MKVSGSPYPKTWFVVRKGNHLETVYTGDSWGVLFALWRVGINAMLVGRKAPEHEIFASNWPASTK
jgi:hypothetical protein